MPISELETLYSARDLAEYEAGVLRFRMGFTWVPVAERAWDRAAQVQHELAKRGQHRAASIPDLSLAATAELNRLTVLHYDRDFDTIAAVTSQPAQWVVPAGTMGRAGRHDGSCRPAPPTDRWACSAGSVGLWA